ncbi:MAG: glycosyltransferase family 1 protein [Deltaproteobacteria bacterium]|nr:glycosyltransferase family 1 protein [Deltaproteobacteria bacterium]
MVLKICWAGWTGPELSECASGILALDPDPQFYILGSATERDESAFWMGHGRRFAYLSSTQRFFEDMVVGGYNVVLHSSNLYAAGHRRCVYSLDPAGRSITDYQEWRKLNAVKILHDAESCGGPLDFYIKLARQCDAVITYGHAMKEFCDKEGIPCYWSFVPCPSRLEDWGLSRDVSVSFTGSNLEKDYRGQLRRVLLDLPDDYTVFIQGGAFDGLRVDQYVELLNRSKICQCTHSSASGSKFPMHNKNREAKALLCGALPITEHFPQADGYLVPGKEKVVFNTLDELRELLIYYLEHEEARKQIITAGQEKIRNNFTSEHVLTNAFQYLKLI